MFGELTAKYHLLDVSTGQSIQRRVENAFNLELLGQAPAVPVDPPRKEQSGTLELFSLKNDQVLGNRRLHTRTTKQPIGWNIADSRSSEGMG